MKTRIEVEFEVELSEDTDEDEVGELDENRAKQAAEQAAFDFLTFCTVSGVNTDTEEVDVYVDGFGYCTVKLAKE